MLTRTINHFPNSDDDMTKVVLQCGMEVLRIFNPDDSEGTPDGVNGNVVVGKVGTSTST